MASSAWPTLQQNRVQASQNKNQTLTAAQQQQMTQAQLTYAQKVKGQPQQTNSSGNQQQPQFRMVPTQNILQTQPSNINMPNMANMAASALSNYAYPYNYSNLQQQQQSSYQHKHHHHQHQSHHPQQRRSQYGQRDFFDRRVQNNVNSAVSQYYNSNSNKRRSNRGYHHGHGQKPAYSSFKNSPNVTKMNENRAKRSKPTDVQLKTYEAAADRDVLCWIYENQGKCRYGEKCQWLHLDRETGKYVPTVYIMNSLKENDIEKDNTIHKINTKMNVNDDDDDEKEEINDNNGDNNNNDDNNNDDDNNDDMDTIELQKKFQVLMEKTIKRNLEKKEETSTEKEDEKDKEKENEKDKEKENEKDKEKENEKNKEQDTDKEGEKAPKSKVSGYGSYGTTFDRHNVCWEFNTFVGCRKGSKCKWAHQYLIKETSHPYTGEKLNGMAVRKFRLSHNI